MNLGHIYEKGWFDSVGVDLTCFECYNDSLSIRFHCKYTRIGDPASEWALHLVQDSDDLNHALQPMFAHLEGIGLNVDDFATVSQLSLITLNFDEAEPYVHAKLLLL